MKAHNKPIQSIGGTAKPTVQAANQLSVCARGLVVCLCQLSVCASAHHADGGWRVYPRGPIKNRWNSCGAGTSTMYSPGSGVTTVSCSAAAAAAAVEPLTPGGVATLSSPSAVAAANPASSSRSSSIAVWIWNWGRRVRGCARTGASTTSTASGPSPSAHGVLPAPSYV